MWVVAVYDCPMTAPEQRQDYAEFRRYLLRENFVRLQFSLYARHVPTMAAADSLVNRARSWIPAAARVAFFLITDKQFEMTREYFGPERIRLSVEQPQQILLI